MSGPEDKTGPDRPDFAAPDAPGGGSPPWEAAMLGLTGTVHHRLAVPAISQPDWFALQRVLQMTLRRLPDSKGRPPAGFWRRLGITLAIALPIGLAVGLGAALVRPNAELWLDFGRFGEIVLQGMSVFWATVALAVLVTYATFGSLFAQSRRALRSWHRAAREMLGAHSLLLAEHGLLWHNASRTVFVPWSRINRMEPLPNLLLLVCDHITAFWIQEEVLAARPDRAELLAWIQARLPA